MIQLRNFKYFSISLLTELSVKVIFVSSPFFILIVKLPSSFVRTALQISSVAAMDQQDAMASFADESYTKIQNSFAKVTEGKL